MRYFKTVSGGYIIAIGIDAHTGEEINQSEYDQIMKAIKSAPTAPDGYAYVLTDSLEWEMVKGETPVFPEEATETDYQTALEEMGVRLNGD